MLTLPGVEPPPRRSGILRAASFVRPYLLGAAGSAYIFALGWTRARHRAQIVELCRHFGYHDHLRGQAELPVIDLASLVPEGTLLDVRAIDSVAGNVSERELIALCGLVRSGSPQLLFEFGTFDGRTTLNLAVNSPAESAVHTLDLPRSSINESAAPLHSEEIRYADKPVSGARFRGTSASGKIAQLYGDSGTFDFSEYEGRVDFVFIDASHTYEYVINDSLNAIRMLRSGRGTIVWHDYSKWEGVTRALNDLRTNAGEFSGLRWIAGTTLAILTR